MRTQGSLRLILNTKLWAQMQIDKASEKSIRITAMDTEDQGVKVFLISVSSPGTGYYQPLGEKKCVNRPLDKGRALLSSHRREVPRHTQLGHCRAALRTAPLGGCSVVQRSALSTEGVGQGAESQPVSKRIGGRETGVGLHHRVPSQRQAL